MDEDRGLETLWKMGRAREAAWDELHRNSSQWVRDVPRRLRPFLYPEYPDGPILMVMSGDQFTVEDARYLAGHDVFLDVANLGPEPLDLQALLPSLRFFDRIRMGFDDPAAVVNLPALGQLHHVRELKVEVALGADVDLSHLDLVRDLQIEGDAVATVQGLPSLRRAVLAMDDLPSAFRLQAPVSNLILGTRRQIENLNVLAEPDALEYLEIFDVPEIDFRWLTPLGNLRSMTCSDIGSVTHPEGLDAESSLTSLVLDGVRSVPDLNAWVSLPSHVGVSVVENFAFPPSFQATVADRGWRFQQYLGRRPPTKRTTPTFVDGADEDTFFPFVLREDPDGYGIAFTAWALAEPFEDSMPAVEEAGIHATVTAMMTTAADRVIPGLYDTDSEADEILVLTGQLDDATRLALELTKLWNSPKKLRTTLRQAAETARGEDD